MATLTNTTWQPSVLHLLPFSNNNAGSAPSRKTVAHAASPSYTATNDDRGFPVLAVTRTDKESGPRSKSATTPGSNPIAHYSKNQQRRYLRASSERLSRGQSHGDSIHKVRLRARSEYGIHSSYNRKGSGVKISVNDINDQILGKKKDEPSSSSSPDMSVYKSETAVTEGKAKSLPKPALKGGWSNSSMKYWRSSTDNPGDINLYRNRNNIDLSDRTLGFRRMKRVKLNVNELPRSKTPIAENDPDKLNMKHVIAFLQTSSKDKLDDDKINDNDDCTVSQKEHIPYHYPSSRVKHLAHKQSLVNAKKNGVVFNNRQYVIRTDSSGVGVVNRKPSEIKMKSEKLSKDTSIPHRLPKSRLSPYHYDPNNNMDKNNDQSVSLSQPTTTAGMENLENSYCNANYLNLSDFQTLTTDTIPGMTKNKQSSLSLLTMTEDNKNIHIPASIRKIRDRNNNHRPFRLHRFLTLVPNGSEALMNMANKLSQPQTPVSRSRTHSRETSRRFSGTSKTGKQNDAYRRSKSEAEYYSADVWERDSHDHSEHGLHRRSKSKSAHAAGDGHESGQDRHKVICLPVAQFEADSDEENGPFSTMPNARNRRALTLSAQGRAIRVSKDVTDRPSRPNSTKEPIRLKTGHILETYLKPSSEKKSAILPSINNNEKSILPNLSTKGETLSTSDQSVDHASPANAPQEIPYNQFPIEAALLGTGSGQMPNPFAAASLKSEPTNIPTPVLKDQLQESSPSAVSPSTDVEDKDPKQMDSTKHPNGLRTSPVEHVKLSLRKERTRTREHTYMVDMADADKKDVDSSSPSPGPKV